MTPETTTGASIIGMLLREDAALTDAMASMLQRIDPSITTIIAAENIKLGTLPEDITLPAMLVRLVSSVERQPLRRGATVRTTDRVSVTVRAASYRDQVQIIRLIRNCCAGLTGDIGNGKAVSILTAGTGPDLIGPGSSFEQAQDFRVSHDA